MKLDRKLVEKPWGVDTLPDWLGGGDGRRIGEIWFDGGQDMPVPLLVKYIYTSEKLSVQVHPNDADAQARGLSKGKNEGWYIVSAEPGATLGIGTKAVLSDEELRAAALDGSIEDDLVWHKARVGDWFYVPAGTVHAIGPGVGLIEVQPNVDITYRLYDYGRPRALHLDDGVAVADARPYDGDHHISAAASNSRELPAGGGFRIWSWTGSLEGADFGTGPWVCIPLDGEMTVDGECIVRGECAMTERLGSVDLAEGKRILIATPAL